ncbi:MAG: hypoxanthine phosphoribosyltransferase [Planctomycetota bacterium]|nr:MAG: hypoxanthine phosphoribosyltransferase [Planctomycetota bacterium]
MEKYHPRTVLDRQSLDQGLEALAGRLRDRLQGEAVTVVAVLGGAVIFAADLVRRLHPGLVMDFLRIQTYGDGMAPNQEAKADWLPHPDNIRGRRVLLVDDILDTGRTLLEARRLLLEDMGAAQVEIAVLVNKPIRRAVPIEADDQVITIEEDLFLVGYGLDLAGLYRNLPELLALDPKRVEAVRAEEAEMEAAEAASR